MGDSAGPGFQTKEKEEAGKKEIQRHVSLPNTSDQDIPACQIEQRTDDTSTEKLECEPSDEDKILSTRVLPCEEPGKLENGDFVLEPPKKRGLVHPDEKDYAGNFAEGILHFKEDCGVMPTLPEIDADVGECKGEENVPPVGNINNIKAIIKSLNITENLSRLSEHYDKLLTMLRASADEMTLSEVSEVLRLLQEDSYDVSTPSEQEMSASVANITDGEDNVMSSVSEQNAKLRTKIMGFVANQKDKREPNLSVGEMTLSEDNMAEVPPHLLESAHDVSTPSEQKAHLTPSEEEKLMAEIEELQELQGKSSENLLISSVSDIDCSVESEYHLKRISWKDEFVPIVTQNENGPCPLIAIVNVLILRGKIKIPQSLKIVSDKQLLEYVADCILSNIPKNLDHFARLDFERNVDDAIGILPRLLTGLDVNVRFTGVNDFEYTQACILFDLLNIPLYHGWLVDPQAADLVEAVGSLGYNQLVEYIIANRYSDDIVEMTRAHNASMFLVTNCSQLTYHGLCEINSTMSLGEVAVLFRNNHFSTIIKRRMGAPRLRIVSEELADASRECELFQLVTDQGLLHEMLAVWETLSNIDGDCSFVDSFFIEHSETQTHTLVTDFGTEPTSSVSDTEQKLSHMMSKSLQIDQDFLVALSLQEDQASDQKSNASWEGFEDVVSNPDMASIDLELARRLQQDYQRDLHAVPPGSPSSSHLRSPDRNKKGSGCTIL